MDFRRASYRVGFALAAVIVVISGYFLFMKTDAPQKEVPAKAKENALAVAAPQKTPTGAILKTSLGDIEVVFFADKAPKTVANFIALAQKGFYDQTKFHRVIKDFMIQGGDPLSKDDTQMAVWGTGGPGYQFADEINSEKLVRGALAMANSGPNTNGSQFFIVTAAATPWLDGKHTVFGKAVKGLDVVQKIGSVETMTRDMPKVPVVIENIILKP